jgi:hypothetical protein
VKTLKGMPMVTVEQCARYSRVANVIEDQRDKLLYALRQAKYLIKGREHTGFIDTLIAETEATK